MGLFFSSKRAKWWIGSRSCLAAVCFCSDSVNEMSPEVLSLFPRMWSNQYFKTQTAAEITVGNSHLTSRVYFFAHLNVDQISVRLRCATVIGCLMMVQWFIICLYEQYLLGKLPLLNWVKLKLLRVSAQKLLLCSWPFDLHLNVFGRLFILVWGYKLYLILI